MPLDVILSELEQNICEDLNVERLAEAGRLSRTQLYREFYSATGHSVKEYVRKRRLSKALALIKHTDKPLQQIALDCGYSTEQALCKGVKIVVGQTSAQYKSSGEEFYFPAYADQRTKIVTVATETIPPTLCLRYYDSCLQGIENRALAWLFSSQPDYRGRIFGRNGKQEGCKLCYELFIEDERANQPAISGMFARTVCPNDEDMINAAWNYLYNDWLKTSMFAMSVAQSWAVQSWFEEYIHTGAQIKRLHLYLPVAKKKGFHKIQLCQCEQMHFLVACKSGPEAEKESSNAVISFLMAHYPHLAQTARRFDVSTAAPTEGLRLVRTQIYTCGIQVQAPLDIAPGRDVKILTQPAGEYAVLEGDCCASVVWAETSQVAPVACYIQACWI